MQESEGYHVDVSRSNSNIRASCESCCCLLHSVFAVPSAILAVWSFTLPTQLLLAMQHAGSQQQRANQ